MNKFIEDIKTATLVGFPFTLAIFIMYVLSEKIAYIHHLKCINIDNSKNMELLITNKFSDDPLGKRGYYLYECKKIFARQVIKDTLFYSIQFSKDENIINFNVGDYILTDTAKYLKIFGKNKKYKFRIKYENAYIANIPMSIDLMRFIKFIGGHPPDTIDDLN